MVTGADGHAELRAAPSRSGAGPQQGIEDGHHPLVDLEHPGDGDGSPGRRRARRVAGRQPSGQPPRRTATWALARRRARITTTRSSCTRSIRSSTSRKARRKKPPTRAWPWSTRWTATSSARPSSSPAFTDSLGLRIAVAAVITAATGLSQDQRLRSAVVGMSVREWSLSPGGRQVRNRFILLGAALFVCSAFTPPLVGQQQTGQGNRGVQVGVPEGRAPGDGGPSNARPKRSTAPPPRSADGRALLGSTATQKGLWLPGPVVPNPLGLPADKDLPFQPWARALHANRRQNQLEPHTRCKPSGGARVFLTPYGVEIVEFPELQRVYIFDVGGPHTFRTIYMDGRTHPKRSSRATTATQSAAGKATRSWWTRLVSTNASGSIGAACRTRTSFARSNGLRRSRHAAVRADDRRSQAPTRRPSRASSI